MGNALGALKVAAHRVGLRLDEYQARVASGQKWCTRCKCWHATDEFGRDRSRGDGLDSHCFRARHVDQPREMGMRRPSLAIGNAASEAVRQAIRRGELAPVTTRACLDCDGPAVHYHHEQGYEPEHHLDVAPLCRSCHLRRHWDA